MTIDSVAACPKDCPAILNYIPKLFLPEHGVRGLVYKSTFCIQLARCIYDTRPFAYIFSLREHLVNSCYRKKTYAMSSKP